MAKGKPFSNLTLKQAKLKEKLSASGDSSNEDFVRESIQLAVSQHKMKVPKNRCPVCYAKHVGDVPELCWKLAFTDENLLFDFNTYLKITGNGKIV